MRKLPGISLKYRFGIVSLLAVLLVIGVQSFYYIEMTKVAKRKVETFTTNSVSQVVETTDLIFDKASKAAIAFSFSNYVQTYMSSKDPFEVFTTKKYIQDMIDKSLEINDEIENVVLFSPAWKRIFYYNDTRMTEALNQIQSTVQRNGGKAGFLYMKGGPVENRDALVYFRPVIYKAADMRNGEKLGSILIFLNRDVMRKIIAEAAGPDDVEFYLIDANGQVVTSNIDAKQGAKNDVFRESKLPENHNMVISKNIGETGWRMVGIVNESHILQDYRFFKSFAIMVGVIMIMLLGALGGVFHWSFARPLSLLFQEIEKIDGGGYRKKLEMPYKNEIGGIAIHINRMLKKLERLTDRHLETQQKMYAFELSRRQTELYALQSQVNPHFLFNTLQCIGGIALYREVPEVARMTMSMSEIFKYSIKGPEDVRIEDEVFIAKQYLSIIDTRFDGKFRWEFDIQTEIMQQKTIKMILQPLVENAIVHGLEKSYEPGTLRISGRKEQEKLLLEVWDNGPGIDKEILARLQKILEDPVQLEKESINKQKIGISNIHWRIRLTYGERYGLKISSAGKEGTVVQVKLPFQPNI